MYSPGGHAIPLRATRWFHGSDRIIIQRYRNRCTLQDIEENKRMREHAWKARLDRRGFAWIGFISVCCFGGSAGQYAWGQASMPPTASAQEATALRPDPFNAALEELSKKFGVAFVAEGRPFPQAGDKPAPLLDPDLALEGTPAPS